MTEFKLNMYNNQKIDDKHSLYVEEGTMKGITCFKTTKKDITINMELKENKSLPIEIGFCFKNNEMIGINLFVEAATKDFNFMKEELKTLQNNNFLLNNYLVEKDENGEVIILFQNEEKNIIKTIINFNDNKKSMSILKPKLFTRCNKKASPFMVG